MGKRLLKVLPHFFHLANCNWTPTGSFKRHRHYTSFKLKGYQLGNAADLARLYQSTLNRPHCIAGRFHALHSSVLWKTYLEPLKHAFHPAKILLMGFAIWFEIHSTYCAKFCLLKFEIPQPDEPFYHVIHYVKQNVTIHWLTTSEKLQN